VSAQNQVRALSRIRRALAAAEAEVVESEREFLEAGGVMPPDVDAALRAFHARVRMANGPIAAHAKLLNDEYDDQKTPARTPSAMIRAADPEAVRAFERSVELMKEKKEPPTGG
jgi:hypothetical protein